MVQPLVHMSVHQSLTLHPFGRAEVMPRYTSTQVFFLLEPSCHRHTRCPMPPSSSLASIDRTLTETPCCCRTPYGHLTSSSTVREAAFMA